MSRKFRKVNADFFVFEQKGQVLEGFYHRGSDVNTVNGMAKSGTIVDEETGEAKRFIISSGMQGLDELADGSYIRLTCEGKKKNEKSNRTYMAFTVEVAEDYGDEG